MLSLIYVNENENSSDCLYSSIASVANSMCNINNQLIGAGAWWFDIKNLMPGQENLIWNQIHAFRFDAWKCLEDFYGIKVIWHNATRIDEIMPDMFKELAEERPVLIYINSHYCPWHPRKKEYNAHFCLAVDYDKKSQEFICMDVNPKKYDERLSLELFSKGCGPYITFSKSDKPCKSVDWKNVVRSAIECLINEDGNAFTLIRELANELKKEINDLKEGVPSWIENPISVISKTGLLQKGRDYFSITLKYLAGQFNVEELIPISERMVLAAQQWKVVSFLAMKSRIMQSDRSTLERIPDKILEIADFEEQIALDLFEVLKVYS